MLQLGSSPKAWERHPRGVRDDETHAVVVGAEIHGVDETVTHRGAFPGNICECPRHVQFIKFTVYVTGFYEDEVAVVVGVVRVMAP